MNPCNMVCPMIWKLRSYLDKQLLNQETGHLQYQSRRQLSEKDIKQLRKRLVKELQNQTIISAKKHIILGLLDKISFNK